MQANEGDKVIDYINTHKVEAGGIGAGILVLLVVLVVVIVAVCCYCRRRRR